MQIKYENPKLRQREIANQLGYSSSLQRYRNDTIMLSPYRSQSNDANKRKKSFQILFLITLHNVNTTSKDFK